MNPNLYLPQKREELWYGYLKKKRKKKLVTNNLYDKIIHSNFIWPSNIQTKKKKEECLRNKVPIYDVPLIPYINQCGFCLENLEQNAEFWSKWKKKKKKKKTGKFISMYNHHSIPFHPSIHPCMGSTKSHRITKKPQKHVKVENLNELFN